MDVTRWLPRPVLWALTLFGACADAVALSDLPRVPRGHLRAVFVIRAAECEGNVAFLSLFDRPAVRERVSLVGIVVLDSVDRVDDVVRRELRANDVRARLLAPSPATRRTLDSLSHGKTPVIVLLDDDARVRGFVHAPQSPMELMSVTGRLTHAAPAQPDHDTR